MSPCFPEMTDCPWEDLEQLKVLQRVEELVEAQGGTCRGAQSLSQDIRELSFLLIVADYDIS